MPETQDETIKVMLLDPDAVQQLTMLSQELHAGSDKERDFGHRLHQILKGAPLLDMIVSPVMVHMDEEGTPFTPTKH